MNNGSDLLVLLVLLAVIGAALIRPRWRGSNTAHGTARWASEADLRRAGMLARDGLLLGRAPSGATIRMPRYTHLSVFAPTGAGKGVSFIVPWLLTYKRGSCVVLDPKGENFNLTAEKRRKLGQKVVRLDPFGVCGPGADSFNPLDLVGSEADCVDDARAMAEAMTVRTGEEKDPHWNDQAANVITGLLAFILSRIRQGERNLSSLRELVTDAGACESAIELMRGMGGVFARLAGVIAQLEEKEKAGVFSTVHRHTTFLDSEAVMGSVSTSSFDARELLKGNVTLYLILPPHQLEAQSRWLRLIIASLIRLIGREGMKDGKETLFVLDEAGQLGHMPPIDQGLTLLRSYGLKMAFFFQSLGQLSATFRGKEAVLLDNTEQIYFGVNSYETAERVSKMLGDATIAVESANDGVSRSRQHQPGHQGSDNVTRSSGRNWAVQARALMKPDEVLTMSSDYLLAFLRDIRPIAARRIKWYEEPQLGGETPCRPLPPLWWVLLAGAVGLVAWAVLGGR